MAARPFAPLPRVAGWRAYLLAVALGALIVALRRPSGLLDAGLWAEDGTVFMRRALLEPVFRSVFDPYNGYLHFVPRVWAEITTLMPIEWLPTSYAMFSVLAASASYAVVLNPGLRWLVPSDTVRLGVFGVLLALPGSSEITGTLTNVLWPAAVALVLLSFANAPASVTGRRVEIAALVPLTLTGAASLLVWPGFVLRAWRERTRHNVVVLGVVLGGAAIQALLVLTSSRASPDHERALSSIPRALFLRVWGMLTVGEHELDRYLRNGVPTLLIAAAAAALAVTAVALARLPRVAALQWLAIVTLTLGGTVWAFGGDLRLLTAAASAGRYFVVPVAMTVLIVAAAMSRDLPGRKVLLIGFVPVLALFAVALVRDYRLPALPATNWDKTAACIRQFRPCRVEANPPAFSFDLEPIAGVDR